MPEFSEHDVEKLSAQPIVQDSTYIDPSTDTTPGGPALGAVVVIEGVPSTGQVPMFNGEKFTPQDGGVGSMVPTYIGPSETFTVPADRQAFFAVAIENDGALVVDGALIEVD